MTIEAYRKFLLLLSSDSDGEVLAAARAIGRKLKAEGHDWYWLADQFVTKPKPRPAPPKRPVYQDFTFEADYVEIFREAEKAVNSKGKWRPGNERRGSRK
jgi:hypothetical protein